MFWKLRILGSLIGFLATLSNDICSFASGAAEDLGIAFALFCRFVISRWIFWASNVSRSLSVFCSILFLRFTSGIRGDTEVSQQIATI